MTQNLPPKQDGVRQLQPGHILVERYLIQDVVGLGGMGSVYRARDLHFPNVVKLVAVKEMINSAPDPLVRQTIVQNFEREANILATLNHPAITKIYDYFSHDERSYLILEYINGKDLEALLNDRNDYFPEEQVIAWAMEICDVLEYLHSHKPEPIIFRDVKPSNIMINQQNRVIMVDFGIAKIFRSGQKGTMIGTEGYSPPEQYRGDATQAADIYALGATLHHLMTRRDPRLEAPFSFSERPIRKINPLVSVEMEAVVHTALQYSPEERFPSIKAMREALMLVAKKTGALTRIATQTIVKSQGVKPLWTFKCEDEVRGSVTFDNGIIFTGAYDNNLYAINAADGKFVWKFPTDGAIVSKPAVDQGLIYFGSADQNLYAVSARTGRVSWSHQTGGAIRNSPKIAEGHVFIASDDGFLYAINLLSTRTSWQVDAGGPIRSTPSLTNEFIYFGSEMGEMICCDYRGQIKWRFRAKRAITSSPMFSNGIIYFTSLDSMIYALDAKAGWVIWRYRMEKGSISSPCKADNYVVVGSADNHIYCLDSASPKEIWKYRAEHQISGSPSVYKDAVYCGSADGTIYCLDIRSGRLRWIYETGGPITGTPLIVNDVMYIGSADHMVYALLT